MSARAGKYTGDHLVHIRVHEMLHAMEAKAEELAIAEIDLCKQIGLTGNFMSMLRHSKQTTAFGQNVAKIEKFLGVDPGTFVRKRRSSVSVNGTPRHVRRRTELPSITLNTDDAVMLTVEYFRAVRKTPIAEQARAQKLLAFLMAGE